MQLYILRHAWAHDRDYDRWPDDADRPLTEEGMQRFRKVARTLVQRGCQPELIGSSPYVRCQQTAQILSEAFKPPVPVKEVEGLVPGSSLEQVLEWTGGQDAQSLVWVGHAPDVGDFVSRLIGDDDAYIRFAKGAMASIRFEHVIAEGAGELQWLMTAKMLGH